jgi:hypothetical protein
MVDPFAGAGATIQSAQVAGHEAAPRKPTIADHANRRSASLRREVPRLPGVAVRREYDLFLAILRYAVVVPH